MAGISTARQRAASGASGGSANDRCRIPLPGQASPLSGPGGRLVWNNRASRGRRYLAFHLLRRRWALASDLHAHTSMWQYCIVYCVNDALSVVISTVGNPAPLGGDNRRAPLCVCALSMWAAVRVAQDVSPWAIAKAALFWLIFLLSACFHGVHGPQDDYYFCRSLVLCLLSLPFRNGNLVSQEMPATVESHQAP